jgi:hypothetical protein
MTEGGKVCHIQGLMDVEVVVEVRTRVKGPWQGIQNFPNVQEFGFLPPEILSIKFFTHL